MVARIFLCFKEICKVMYQSIYANNTPYYNSMHGTNAYNPYAMNGGGIQPNFYGNQPQQPAIGQQSIGQPQVQQQGFVTPPPKSNKILVVSLEDALSKCNEPNSDTMCLDQDKPLIYNISVDMQGRKSYQTYDISLHQPQEKTEQTQEEAHVDYVSMATFSNLQAQFLSLQNRFNDLVERLKSSQNGSNVQSKVNTQEGVKKA